MSDPNCLFYSNKQDPLLKCGWCLVTMYASFPYYVHKIVEADTKYVQISYLFFFLNAQVWNYGCNRRNNETAYNFFQSYKHDIYDI